MKKIYFLFLLVLSLTAHTQAVTADPAVGALNITDNVANIDMSRAITTVQSVTLKVPIFNLSPYNAIPSGSTTIIIGLGGKLKLDPSFNVATARLSSYFSFSYNTTASQPRIIGTQIAAIPKDFIDSTAFRVIGTTAGSSAASVNFAINPSGNLDDEDGNNNSSSISYTVISILPVKLTQFDVAKTGCNIDVNFNTEDEANVSRYETEVSKDGNAFSKLGEVIATGAGRYNITYPITDNITAVSLFVRLKTIDKDLKFVYSAVKRISAICNPKAGLVLSVFPNPLNVGTSLTVTSLERSFNGRYNVSLVDVTGRILQTRVMQLGNVSNFKFDLGNVAGGQYLLKIATLDGAETAIVHFQKQ